MSIFAQWNEIAKRKEQRKKMISLGRIFDEREKI